MTEKQDTGWDDTAATFDDGGFHQTRRATDQPAAALPAPDGPRPAEGSLERRSVYSRWTRRRTRAREGSWSAKRDMLRRLREPVIGLTLAGAAGPLAMNAREHKQNLTGESNQQAGATTMGMAQEGMLEDAVGERWRQAAGGEAMQDTVQKAVERYAIAPDLAEEIATVAEKNGISADLAFGLVKTESTFNQRAVSHVGARGLTQVMPRTAKWLRPGTTAEDLFDRTTNLELGFSYLRDLIDKYNGDTKLALLAYNRGPGTVDKILKRGGNPDNGYADKVIKG